MDLDLSTIDNGNLKAIVDFNYKKILKNIMDHTTDPTAKRKMIITIEFQPIKNRDMVKVTYEVKRKEAMPLKGTTTFRIVESGYGYHTQELASGQLPGQVVTGEVIADEEKSEADAGE